MARDGFTADGARTGSLPFAVAMAAVAIAATVGAYPGTSRPAHRPTADHDPSPARN
jgi:hypothetical protein